MEWTVFTIRDGWGKTHPAISKENAFWQAGYFWDSGEYEQVSVKRKGVCVFFRRQKWSTRAN